MYATSSSRRLPFTRGLAVTKCNASLIPQANFRSTVSHRNAITDRGFYEVASGDVEALKNVIQEKFDDGNMAQ